MPYASNSPIALAMFRRILGRDPKLGEMESKPVGEYLTPLELVSRAPGDPYPSYGDCGIREWRVGVGDVSVGGRGVRIGYCPVFLRGPLPDPVPGTPWLSWPEELDRDTEEGIHRCGCGCEMSRGKCFFCGQERPYLRYASKGGGKYRKACDECADEQDALNPEDIPPR